MYDETLTKQKKDFPTNYIQKLATFTDYQKFTSPGK